MQTFVENEMASGIGRDNETMQARSNSKLAPDVEEQQLRGNLEQKNKYEEKWK